jgi:hypothetical protein
MVAQTDRLRHAIVEALVRHALQHVAEAQLALLDDNRPGVVHSVEMAACALDDAQAVLAAAVVVER